MKARVSRDRRVSQTTAHQNTSTWFFNYDYGAVSVCLSDFDIISLFLIKILF